MGGARGETAAVVALGGTLLLGRLFAASALDPLADEAYHWGWSRALAWGYFDQPPLVAAGIAAGEALLGHRALADRLPGLLAIAGGCVALWPWAGDRGTFVRLFLGLPALAFLGTLAVPDAYLLAAWAVATAGAAAGGRGWWLAGVAAGLATLAKHDGALLYPALWLSAPERGRRDPAVGALLGAAVVAPHLAWLASHGFAPVVFQVGENLAHPHPPGAWGPVRFLAEQTALAAVVPAVAFPVAVHRAVRSGDRVERLLVASSAPVAAVFLLASPFAPPEAHWPAPAWVGGAVLLSRLRGRWGDAAAVGSWLAVFATAALGAHALHPRARWPVDPGVRFTEGRSVAEVVAREALPEGVGWWEPGALTVRDVFTERYQEASLVAWHTGIPARVYPGCGRRNQDDLLPPPAIPDAFWYVRPARGGPPRCVAGAVARWHTARETDAFGRALPAVDVLRFTGEP